jgi:hypothetical protein
VVIVADERGLRCLPEHLAPYMPAPMAAGEPDRWLTTREVAEYAGTMTGALHKPAHETCSEENMAGAMGWLKRADIDARRRAERPGGAVKRVV